MSLVQCPAPGMSRSELAAQGFVQLNARVWPQDGEATTSPDSPLVIIDHLYSDFFPLI